MDDVNNGLYQSARGLPRGKYEKGVDDFEELQRSSVPRFWDGDAQAHWTFDGREFWTFDDPESAGNKGAYARSTVLRGVMFWELSGDDPAGSLITALYNGLTGSAP